MPTFDTFLSPTRGNHFRGPSIRASEHSLIGCSTWTECSMYMPSASDRAPLRTAAQPLGDRPDGVEVDIVHSLLERDDGIVGDLDVLGAHLGAALRDVAVTHARLAFEHRPTVQDVLGVHVEARDANHEPRTVKHALRVVRADHVAYVLAQEALDALAELHHPLDVFLLHAPGFAAGRVLIARRER